MDIGLKGKSALVLASSSGLGKGIATELAREQAKVMLFSSSEEKLKQAQAEIEKETGNRPDYFVGSILKPDDIKSLVKVTAEKNGPIFALVNNTGGPKPGSFETFADQDWQDAFELCLMGYIRAIRETLPYMKQNGGGRILCSTSSSVKSSLDLLILSNTFRMGVVGLAKTLSRELGKDNILVNVLGPGRVETDRLNQIDRVRSEKLGVTVEELKKQIFSEIPLGRYGKSDEYGRFAAFLCSQANTYITGQTFLLDGGMVRAY